VFIVAGTHVPVIPFVEVVGRTGEILFWHRGPITAKVGVTAAFVVIVSVAVVAH